MRTIKLLALGSTIAAAMGFAGSASAATCIGNCGTAGPDGVVTASPTGNPTYQYVSTAGGSSIPGVGEIDGVGDGSGEQTGSQFTSNSFNAAAGDELTFFFNYVSSDGAGFADYGWAALLDSAGDVSAWLFTGRTQASGNIAPGVGLPALDATLTPGSSAIIPGGPAWSPLGGSSGGCFSSGCGYTGWIESAYTIGSTGTYSVRYGVTNWNDSLFQSGLAFDGLALNDVVIDSAVPEPGTWAMLLLGFFSIGFSMRARKNKVRRTTLSYS